MRLLIKPASLVATPKPDGMGYDLRREGEHCAHLTIGNVSVAFDGCNNWVGGTGRDSEVILLSEDADCPVRVHGRGLEDIGGPAILLLYALADDLGYSVKRDAWGL